eukprot:9130662-Pyramimonas_sp.AAC.2
MVDAKRASSSYRLLYTLTQHDLVGKRICAPRNTGGCVVLWESLDALGRLSSESWDFALRPITPLAP